MKILIIGSSHSGAIKLGIERLRSNQYFPGNIDFNYACTPLQNFQKFNLSGNFLRHPKDETIQKIGLQFPLDLQKYDKIIYVEGKNPLEYRHYFSRADRYQRSILPSRSIVESIVLNVAGRHWNKKFRLLQDLKERYSEKLFIVPHPLISEDAKPEVIDRSIPTKLMNIIRNVSNLSLMKVDVPSIILPPEKLLSSCQQYTKRIYNKSGANILGKEIRQDFMHMNGAYGEIYAKKILEALEVL